jgi:cysteine-rich repeat protein
MRTAIRFSASVGLLALLAAAPSACLDAVGAPCGGGYCPGGYTCSQDERCVFETSCGNAIWEPLLGEVCDDGNRINGDGCSANCKSNETCGNGFTDEVVGEACDDENLIGGDGCSADCKSNETCGNGFTDRFVGEACDDENRSGGDGCSANCASNETCGNNFVDKTLGEICDDGNNTSGDGCSADCVSDERCGNGIIDEALGEICDDGNNLDRDTCPSSCKYDCEFEEVGYLVCHDALRWQEARDACQRYGRDLVIIGDTNENSRVRDLLSNDFWIGLSDGAQEGTFRWVDDSALSYQAWAIGEPSDSWDDRSEDCVQVSHQQPGQWDDSPCDMQLAFICEPSDCTDCRCGNGQVEPGEACDDGNAAPGDGCDAACRLEFRPESEPNEDGTPEVGDSFEGNDFSTANANGPYEADTYIAATLAPAGDEDVFMVTNRGPGVVRVRFSTHDAALGWDAPCFGIDTVLVVRDTLGNVLAFNDDRADSLCSTVDYDIWPGATVYAHVLDFGDDGEISASGYWLAVDFQ